MTSRRYTIPFVPPLPPGLLSARPRPFETALECAADRVRYYYLARNAIWHGVPLLGLAPGDGILMPIYHHGVEVDTLVRRGYRLHFYRIDGNMRIDLEHLASIRAPGVKALYVIHYLGMPQPTEELRRFAGERGLRLIEDCALSLFSRDGDRPLGGSGDLSIYCLYKTLPVPHGGVLRVNDSSIRLSEPAAPPGGLSTGVYLAHRTLEFYELAWSPWGGDRLVSLLRGAARIAKGASGAGVVAVDTPRFHEAEADLGMASVCRRILDRVDPSQVVARRRRNYEELAARLDPAVRVLWRSLPPGMCPLSLPILVRDKPATQERLRAAGVQTVNFWYTVHPSAPHDDFPEALALRRQVLELPVHQELDSVHMRFIADRANEQARW